MFLRPTNNRKLSFIVFPRMFTLDWYTIELLYHFYSSTKLFGHGYYALLASSYINNKKKRQLAELRGEATTRILDKKGSNYEISPKELNTEISQENKY